MCKFSSIDRKHTPTHLFFSFFLILALLTRLERLIFSLVPAHMSDEPSFCITEGDVSDQGRL